MQFSCQYSKHIKQSIIRLKRVFKGCLWIFYGIKLIPLIYPKIGIIMEKTPIREQSGGNNEKITFGNEG